MIFISLLDTRKHILRKLAKIQIVMNDGGFATVPSFVSHVPSDKTGPSLLRLLV